MDYIDIPSCALLRHGTVRVRLRMEVSCDCGRPSLLQDYPEAVHRLTKCQQCYRTRTISQFSDCDTDSVLVKRKCRPYRRSSARSRYVNVCAAACLILLAGGLSARSAAAPAQARGRAMEDPRGKKENPVWANPCDTTIEINVPTYTSDLPRTLSAKATNILLMMDSFKDDLAYKTLTGQSFDQVLKDWEGYDWLDKFMSLQERGFREKAIHPDKQLGKQLRNAEDLQPMMKDIDILLPYMYKSSKMLLAGMYQVKDLVPVDEDTGANDQLKPNFISLMTQFRAFVCDLKELLRSRHLAVLPLYDQEIPDLTRNWEVMGNIFQLFRDTITYLEYMQQVADTMKTSLSLPSPPTK